MTGYHIPTLLGKGEQEKHEYLFWSGAVRMGNWKAIGKREDHSPFPAHRHRIAVRYGWANVPDVNLFNQEALPASPFRADAE